MSSGTPYRVALVRTDVSENIASTFRVPQGDRIAQLCSHEIAVDQPFLRRYYVGSKNSVFWDAFAVVSIIEAF
jgi:hypothetical protein